MNDARSLATTVATLRHIPAFLAVARHRSFTRAADELHVSQPSITAAVRQLERVIGTPLFERTTRRVALTSEGSDFLPTAARLMLDCELALRSAGRASGRHELRLRIAAVHAVATKVLPRAIRDFSRANPEVHIILRDGNSTDVLRSVELGEVDIGFAGREGNSELDFVPLFRDKMVVLARAGHELFKRKRQVRWRDLRDFDFIGFTDDTGGAKTLERGQNLPANVTKPRCEVSNYASLWAMLQSSDSVATIPRFSFPSDAGLAFRQLRDPVLYRTVFAVSRHDAPLSRAAAEAMSGVKRAVERLRRETATLEAL